MRSLIPRPARRTPSLGRTQSWSGIPLILVGFLTSALSNAFEGGFLRGFFQGATIALMVAGAYLIGAGLWFSRTADEELRNDGPWLPSRDGRGDGT